MKNRHVLSLEEQRAGIAAALQSRKTPRQLRPGLRRRLADLNRQLRATGGTPKKVRKPRFLGWLEW